MAIELFTLVRERCLLGHLNIRTEMHGDEREAAVDIKFSFSGANNLLAKLHADLRATFYKANDTRDLVNPDHMPHLRFPMLGAQSYELEIPRTRLRVHDAEDASHDVVLGGGKTNKFKFTMKEGGTVEFEFRCQFSKPDEDAIAKLMRVLNQVVPITLECADEEEKADNFQQADLITKTPISPARAKAEDLFLSSPATDMKLADPVATMVALVERGPDDDVVDATYTPPVPGVTVTPIKPKRVTKAAPEAAADAAPVAAAPKVKRTSRKAAEVE
ncbi:MAG: hypothetical protein V4631_22020 [Pseudomonadota bacterium]